MLRGMLQKAIGETEILASDKGISPYDVETPRDLFIKDFAMRISTSCTEFVANKYYERLVYNDYFVENGVALKLNRDFADKGCELGIRFPEDKPYPKPKKEED